MAYNTEILFKRAITAIEGDEDIVFVEDVIRAIGISKFAFYDHFKKDSNEYNAIHEKLFENRGALQKHMRSNWKKETASPTLQLSLYKMITSKENREILNNETPKSQEFKPKIPIENFTPLKGSDDGSNDLD